MNLFHVLSFVVVFYDQRLDEAVGYALATAVFGLGGLGVSW